MRDLSRALLFVPKIQRTFPNLISSEYIISSPDDIRYNCIAWVAEDDKNWWWPDSANVGYWPIKAPRESSLTAFEKAFETLGYAVCDNEDFEKDYLKIAFYVGASGNPTHGARQNMDGVWLSKLGPWPDIEHKSLEGLFSDSYGFRIGLIMKRSVDYKK